MARAWPVEGITVETPVRQAAPRILAVRLAELAAQRERALARADPEDLHDLRVTTRRLRAALALVGGPLALAGSAVKLLGRALGRVRDVDVLSAWLTDAEKAAEPDERPGIAALRARLISGLGELESELRTAAERFQGELEPVLTRYARAAGFAGAMGDPAVRKPVARRLRRLGRLIDELDSVAAVEPVHAVRIAAKRARYHLEVLALAIAQPAQRALSELKRLQDLVGEVRDRDVRLAHLPEWIASAARTEQPGAVRLLRDALDERRRWAAELDREMAAWRDERRARRLCTLIIAPPDRLP